MNPEERPASLEWQRYLAMFHRRRGLVLTCFGVSLVVATIYNYTTRPQYRSSAQILTGADTLDPMPARRGQRRAQQDMARHLMVLRSRALSERVVDRMKLNLGPELRSGPMMSPWERFERRVLGRAPAMTDEQGMPLTPAAAAFRSRLSVNAQRQDAGLIDITFVAYDPGLAADAANAVAETYIAHSYELEENLTAGATGWLSARLSEQKDLVERAERALTEYQEERGISNVEERLGMLEQKLNSLHGALLAARTARMSKETEYQEMLSLGRSELLRFPAVSTNGSVTAVRVELDSLQAHKTKLSASLGDRHPDMLAVEEQLADARRRLEAAIDEVVREAGNAYRLALQQEQTFEESLEPVQRELQDLKSSTVEYDFLKREAQANEQLFKNIMNRSTESRLEGEIDSGSLQIVERAEPAKAPFHPRKLRNYQTAALVGLALGLGLVLIVEHADQTLKTPEDVKEQLGVPFLGMVPDTARPGKTGPALASPLILRNPRSALAEAYRVIRTNLIFSAPDATGRTMVVSSVNPSEGKSTNVLNIAASLAHNDARVLVIDADLRRPTIHQHFNVSSTPGLSDLIVGKSTREEAIRATPLKGLEVLPCGYIPPNPAELLGSARMRSLVEDLRQKYDWILVDAPPILAMADAPVIASMVDGLLLIVAAERTQRAAALRALDQISGVGGSLVGVLLNRVNLQRNSFYFGQYYGEYYTSYYGAGTALAGGADASPQRRAAAPARRA